MLWAAIKTFTYSTHLENATLSRTQSWSQTAKNKYVLHTPQAIDTGYDDNSEKIKLYATRLVLAKDGEDWVYVPEYDNNKNFKGDVNFYVQQRSTDARKRRTNIETDLPNVIIGLYR